jgi:hypothetical protein
MRKDLLLSSSTNGLAATKVCNTSNIRERYTVELDDFVLVCRFTSDLVDESCQW